MSVFVHAHLKSWRIERVPPIVRNDFITLCIVLYKARGRREQSCDVVDDVTVHQNLMNFVLTLELCGGTAISPILVVVVADNKWT